MSDRTAVTLLGCGRWGRNILRDLIILGCDVQVIDPSPESRALAVAAGASSASASMPAGLETDGYVVATPASTHATVIEQIGSRGVPMFIEKPLTTDRASAEEIAGSLAGRLFVMHKWRYHPAIEELASLARAGALGPVTGLRTQRIQPTLPGSDVDATWTLAPHDLSIAIEILGSIPPPRFAVKEGDHPGAGMLAILGTAPWFVMEVSAARLERRRQIDLFCEQGAASWSDDANVIRVRVGEEWQERPLPAGDPPLLRELAAFVGFLRGGPPPRSDAAEGVAVVSAIAALREMAGLSAAADFGRDL